MATASKKKEKALVIVESPAKSKTIKKILGDGYTIEASMGHIRNLPTKDPATQNLGFDVNNHFIPKFEIIPGKQKVVTKLNDLAKKMDKIYLAADPDREGEAIAWHVRQVLKVPDDKIYRVVFNEITPKAVKHSIENPRSIDMEMVQAQQTRQILDKLVGFKLSPVLWKQIGNRNLSAGRVQSVALRMVCEREEEIEAFIPQEYWTIHTLMDKEGKQFEAELSKIKGKTVEKTIKTKEDADKIFACLKDLEVHYGEVVVSDNLELNKIYYDFDNWAIQKKDGSVVSKKKLKAEIEKVKIRDIEELWSIKYEDAWGTVRSELENSIFNSADGIISNANKEYLMKFYTALDWRSIKSNIQFNDAWEWLCKEVLRLDEIDIPEKERELPILDNAAEEMKHNLLLKFYRQYLNDSGVIYIHAMANLSNTSFHFLVADGPETFNTSDNPAFVFRRLDGKLQGVLPLSPRILMAQGRNSGHDKNFYVTHITDEAVKRYNIEIEKNAANFVVQLNN